MSATYSLKCPECRTTLTSRRPIPGGKLLTCPQCDVMFAAPKRVDDDVVDDVEVVDDVDVVDDVEVIDDVEVVDDESAGPRNRRPAVNEGIEIVDDDESPRRAKKTFRPKRKNAGGKGMLIGILAGTGTLVVCGIGALLWWLLGGGGDEPLAYLPANSPMVGGADIKAILASPLGTSAAALMGTPALPFTRMIGATNNTPMRDGLDRVVFTGGENGFAIVVKTTVSIDKDKLATSFGSSTTASVGGRSINRLSGQGANALFVPNKQIAVFSSLPDDQLGGIAGSAGKKSALTGELETLAAKFSGNTIWFVIGPEGMASPTVKGMMQLGMAADPTMKALAPTIQSAKGFVFAANIAGNDVDLRMGCLCADDAAAQTALAAMQQANAKSKSDPLAKAMMLAAPAWAKKLEAEAEANTQASTDGALALMSTRISMSTLQAAIDGMASKMASSGAGAAPDGSGAAPMMIPKGRRPGG